MSVTDSSFIFHYWNKKNMFTLRHQRSRGGCLPERSRRRPRVAAAAPDSDGPARRPRAKAAAAADTLPADSGAGSPLVRMSAHFATFLFGKIFCCCRTYMVVFFIHKQPHLSILEYKKIV